MQKLCEAVGRTRKAKASLTMLLLPSVWFVEDDPLPEVKRAIVSSIKCLDFATAHYPKFADCCINSLKSDITWTFDRRLGWVNNSNWSFRNPKVGKDLDRYRSVRRLLRGVKRRP